MKSKATSRLLLVQLCSMMRNLSLSVPAVVLANHRERNQVRQLVNFDVGLLDLLHDLDC